MSGIPVLARGPAAAQHSGIREIADAASSVDGAIRLDLGQPDFATPGHIVAAAKAAIDDGWTAYTATKGLLSLRELIAAKVQRVNGFTVDPDQVAVGCGGVSVIAAAFAAVLEPGDEVLIPDPGWPQYELMAAWTNARAVRYPCPPELGYHPDLDRVAALVTPATRLLVCNSPNNPTGAVYSPGEIEAIAEIASRNNLWLLSDECYDQEVFEGPAVSAASILDDGRVISAYTFSKTYAMTGWRLGYLCGAPRLIDSVVKVLESQCSCAPSISQKAGEAALRGPQACVTEMCAAYRRRRDLAVELLREADCLVSAPAGAFYVMADISRSRLDARDFALRLLRERAVSVAPGTAFGTVGKGAVRISLASSEQDLREGIGRITDYLDDPTLSPTRTRDGQASRC